MGGGPDRGMQASPCSFGPCTSVPPHCASGPFVSNSPSLLSFFQDGVGYRLSRMDGIYETHLRVAGVKELSYSVTGDSSIAGGDSVAELEVC